MISHNLAVVRLVADQVAVMQGGQGGRTGGRRRGPAKPNVRLCQNAAELLAKTKGHRALGRGRRIFRMRLIADLFGPRACPSGLSHSDWQQPTQRHGFPPGANSSTRVLKSAIGLFGTLPKVSFDLRFSELVSHGLVRGSERFGRCTPIIPGRTFLPSGQWSRQVLCPLPPACQTGSPPGRSMCQYRTSSSFVEMRPEAPAVVAHKSEGLRCFHPSP